MRGMPAQAFLRYCDCSLLAAGVADGKYVDIAVGQW